MVNAEMEKILKLAFVIPHSKQVPAWYYETIQKVKSLPFVETSFLVVEKNIDEGKIKAPVFYKLFKRFEQWWFKSSYDATKPVMIGSITAPTVISFTSKHWLLNEEQLTKLQKEQFDLIYTIDWDPSKKENLSEAANYGLWYTKFGSGKYFNTNPPAFWEVMNDDSSIGSYLLARKNGTDSIIYEGSTNTVPYSVMNSYNSVAWTSASFLPNRINTLFAHAEDFFFVFNSSLAVTSTTNKIPGNFEMAFLFVRNVLRYLAYKIKKQKNDLFTLLIANESFDFERTKTFHSIKPPKNSFYADPFVVEKDGINYIFFEEFIFSKNKAHISIIELNSSENTSPPKIVLDRPYHLSYPFIFCHNDEYFMVPETSSHNTVELYRAKGFPHDWEFIMNLVEGKSLIDVTLHFENGLWWMFANKFDHPFASTNDQLFLYYSKELLSTDWTPHPQNPVVTHIGNCRSAGRLFKKNGKLHRPAQNNASKQYGYGLNINEVIVLNEKEYLEKEVFSFDLNKAGLKACHHMDFTKALTVIDGILK